MITWAARQRGTESKVFVPFSVVELFIEAMNIAAAQETVPTKRLF
jgi:F0F1-type ATP synthase membrane subunit c/vacuolar-type H+-ATPase subunit K